MKGIFVKSLLALLLFTSAALASNPLPSWNDTASKKAIITFVGQVSKEASPGFVRPAERVAVYDNDSTFWSEQPMYFQASFIVDRLTPWRRGQAGGGCWDTDRHQKPGRKTHS